MSFDFASLVKGPSAPDLAILALLSSCVARLVMQPTALHWTSTLVDIICRIRGERPPSRTMATLFSAAIPSVYDRHLSKQFAYYSRLDFPTQRWPLFVLLCRRSGGGRGWVQGYLGRLL